MHLPNWDSSTKSDIGLLEITTHNNKTKKKKKKITIEFFGKPEKTLHTSIEGEYSIMLKN